MKKLAFITSEVDPQLIRDDQLAIAPLLDLGFSVEPLIWDGAEIDLLKFDAFIFRSCWNYHRKFQDFLNWIQELKKTGKPILNPIDISIWNLNKKYLLELEKKGAVIPTTILLPVNTVVTIAEITKILDEIGSEQVVIKPAVSLNGEDTYLVSKADLNKIEDTLTNFLKYKDVLIQKFIPEIKTNGEISLIFFNGVFSHAIRKVPDENEFRVQIEYGGTRMLVIPGQNMIDQASSILKMVGVHLLFARVDFVESNGEFNLLELEIIDPMLFLGFSEEVPRRFALAIQENLKRK